MIRIEDLRLGNHVTTKQFPADLSTVIRLDLFEGKIVKLMEEPLGYAHECPISDLMGKRLIPGLLVKLGFQRSIYHVNDVYTKLPHELAIGFERKGKVIELSSIQILKHFFDKPPIEFLHELENLYFCLTHEELTLNTKEYA